MELSDSGKVKKRYVRGNDLVFVDKGTETEKQYYVTDPHGNVVQLTDGNGKVTKTYEYDSFGNEVKPDEKDDNPFRYCGEYYDKEIGEVYLRARYYQPEKGRFLTRDTYTGEEDEPRSLHLYAYCYNNPVTFSDAGGDEPVSDVMAAGIRIAKTFTSKKNKTGKKNNKIYKKKGMGKTYRWPKDDTGKTWSRNLKVCTDGNIKYINEAKKGHWNDNKYFYGDTTHQNSISYGNEISSDAVPYVVVTTGNDVKMDLSAYLYSLAVITCGSNVKGTKVRKGDYLYCAVLETHEVSWAEMGEVSIFAAWKVLGIKNKEHIGNSFPDNRGGEMED